MNQAEPSQGEIDILPAREGYDRWAEIYDSEDNSLIALEQPRVDELLGDISGLDVADVGCGTGRHSLRLAARGARVTALDFSEGMIDRIRQKPGWEQIQIVNHDLTRQMPFGNGSFDRVLCALVLEHIKELQHFFAELRRICRPDGYIVLSTLHPAMMLRGITARFTDPTTGRETRPQSHTGQISDYVMAAVNAGLRIDHLSEHAVDEAMAARSVRAAKYLNWPMLLMMRLAPA